MDLKNITSFALLEQNIQGIRSKKESLTFAEIATMNALIYLWHKKGSPAVMELADREYESIIGLCRNHATTIRRSLREKGIIDFEVRQGRVTRYIFGPSAQDEKTPPRRSREPIENKEALIEAMRRQNPTYKEVDLSKHYNQCVMWYSQNKPGTELTPSMFRAWMRNQEKNGFGFHPLPAGGGEKMINGSNHPEAPSSNEERGTTTTPKRPIINQW